MHKLKRIFMVFSIVVVLLVAFAPLKIFAKSSNIKLPDVRKDMFVYDQGDFLNDEEEKNVNELLVKLEKATTIELAVITIPSLNDLTIEEYANKMANELGIGKKEKDNGVLLLISKNDTKVRLEIGNGLQGILTDSISGRILDNYFVPYRENDEYDKAVSQTVQAVINRIASSEEYDFSIEGVDSSLVVDDDISGSTILIIILVIFVIALALEGITGYLWGTGFGDGIIFLLLECIADSDFTSSGGSSGGGHFGGGGFSGGGASR